MLIYVLFYEDETSDEEHRVRLVKKRKATQSVSSRLTSFMSESSAPTRPRSADPPTHRT